MDEDGVSFRHNDGLESDLHQGPCRGLVRMGIRLGEDGDGERNVLEGRGGDRGVVEVGVGEVRPILHAGDQVVYVGDQVVGTSLSPS